MKILFLGKKLSIKGLIFLQILSLVTKWYYLGKIEYIQLYLTQSFHEKSKNFLIINFDFQLVLDQFQLSLYFFMRKIYFKIVTYKNGPQSKNRRKVRTSKKCRAVKGMFVCLVRMLCVTEVNALVLNLENLYPYLI